MMITSRASNQVDPGWGTTGSSFQHCEAFNPKIPKTGLTGLPENNEYDHVEEPWYRSQDTRGWVTSGTWHLLNRGDGSFLPTLTDG
jgi:hypothetical protein